LEKSQVASVKFFEKNKKINKKWDEANKYLQIEKVLFFDLGLKNVEKYNC